MEHRATFAAVLALTAPLSVPAIALSGLTLNAAFPTPASAASDDGLPKRVVYNNQKYLLTPNSGGLIYTVAVEGSSTPLGMVVRPPNGPVRYKAFDNTLESAQTVKAVYAVFLNPPGSSGETAAAPGTPPAASTGEGAARLAAPPKFSRDDFDVQVTNRRRARPIPFMGISWMAEPQ